MTISLPLWPLLTSISQFILLGNWLIAGVLLKKFSIVENFRKYKTPLVSFCVLYFIHLLGLIHTENFIYAANDLKIKLPLLVLPVVIATSPKISERKFIHLFYFLIIALILSTFISIFRFILSTKIIATEIRKISHIISHIRLSLLINLGIFTGFYFLYKAKYSNKLQKWFLVISILWLIIFLLLLKSLTGIVIFLLISGLVFLFLITKVQNFMIKWFSILAVITVVLVIFSFITHSISKFYSVESIDFETIDKKTLNGNPYTHHYEDKTIENGHYVGLFQCEKELRREWNKRSKIDYDGKDNRNQGLKFTLMRYLTSKGLKKDSIGISKLTNKDILLIENGIANYIYVDKYGFYPRIYQTIWELDVYFKGFNPSGHSVSQRFEYLKNGFDIISENFLFGVGTGDLQDEYLKKYAENKSPLYYKFRRRAHNQYVTFVIAFGIIGFMLVMFSIFYPPIRLHRFKNFYFTVFFIIAILSMLNEDTLETQAGSTFFAFFYSLFVFGQAKGNKS